MDKRRLSQIAKRLLATPLRVREPKLKKRKVLGGDRAANVAVFDISYFQDTDRLNMFGKQLTALVKIDVPLIFMLR